QLVVGEIEVRQPLPPPRLVMESAEVDRVHHRSGGGGERGNGREVAGEQEKPGGRCLPRWELGRGLGEGGEAQLDLRRHGHAVQLLLPPARRDLIVHQDHQLDPERAPPSHDDLAVDQAIVHPVDEDGHQGTLIARSPAAAARLAAASGVCDRWNTKSTSIARFTPVTTFTLERSRSRASTAIRHDPAAMSTNTTESRSPTASRIRASSAPRSQPLFETGLRTPRTPVICSAASTSALAMDP